MTPAPTDQGGIPWSAIIVALITLGTFFTHQIPLQGVRPDPRVRPHGPPVSAETVPARLWQDPFEAVELHTRAPATRAAWFPPADRRLASKGFAELCSAATHTSDSTRERNVLAAMVFGGPYPEEAESRIRLRYGVLSGLAMEGYQPDDEGHIGRVSVSMESGNGAGSELVIPYECFSSGNADRALVLLWLRGEAFEEAPLTRLNGLLEGLERPRSWRFTLLGPNRSSILSAMAREAAAQTSRDPSSPAPQLQGSRILSFAATADERYLLPSSKTRQTLEGLLSKAFGIDFQRTIATDGDLGCLLARELMLRGASPLDDEDLPAHAPRRARTGERYSVLIGEWDSLYARRLREDLKTKICLGKGAPCTDRVLGYGYLRGIDGKIVAPPKARAANSQQLHPPERQGRSSIARPAGPGQYDYLRRLARTLNAMDQAMRKDGGRIAAVGVIGTDVYDKLLVLQALEPRLPGALFFSTDLSADLAHAEELRWSRNLVVASGFGLRLSDDLQGEILPFRDSYQTSAFLATRLALGTRTLENGKRPAPRIFEIGRYGPIQLKQMPAEGAKEITTGGANGPTTNRLKTRTKDNGIRDRIQPTPPVPPLLSLDWPRLALALATACLLVFIYWEKLRRAGWTMLKDQFSPRPVTAWGYVRDVLYVLVAAILAIALIRAASALGSAITNGIEPLYLTAGVSIWPSELIRLLAIGFALHYLYRCHVAMPRELDRLEGRLFAIRNGGTPARPATRSFAHLVWRLTTPLRIARRWRALPGIVSHGRLDIRNRDSGAKETDVPLGRLWWRYRRLGSARHIARWLRVLLPAGIVVAFINRPLIEVLGIPSVPARGAAAFAWDFGILIAAIAVLLILVFSVLDTIRLTSRLIGLLAKHRIDWPQRAVESFLGDQTVVDDSAEGLEDPYREWLGVQLVGELTAIVGKLVYFPFLVVFLMVASRLSFFDRWDYPLGLVIVILLTLSWAIFAALKLRRSAEEVRDLTVRKIDRHIARILHKETREDAPASGSCRHFPHLARDSDHSDRSNCDLLRQAQRQTRNEHLRYLRARILGYRVGAFSSFLRQPLVQTLMVVVSGLVIYLVDLIGV